MRLHASLQILLGILLGIVLSGALHAQEIMHTGVLRGAVLDPDGRPVRGAHVELWRSVVAGFNCIDLELARKQRLVRRMPLAKDGTFAAHLPLGFGCELRLDVPPYAKVFRDHVSTGEKLVLNLQPPATLKGVVRHAGDGKPCTGARVRIWEIDHSCNGRETTSDAQGAFTLTRLTAGTYFVAVIPRRAARPMWKQVVLEIGASTDVRFEVDAGKRVAGRVVDAVTGLAIAGAEVNEGWTFDRPVPVDPAGRFVMEGFEARYTVGLYARAPGYVRKTLYRREKIVPRKGGVLEYLPRDLGAVTIALRRGHVVQGRILDPKGGPAAGVYVAVVSGGEWLGMRTDDRGVFRIDGLRAGVERTLFIQREGFATTLYTLGPAADDAKVVDLRATPFVLQPRHVLRVRVLSGGVRAPYVDQRAELWGYNTDRCRLHRGAHLVNPLGGVEHNVAKRRVRTDHQGFCHFGDLPAGVYRLEVGGVKVKDIVIRPDEPVREMEVER